MAAAMNGMALHGGVIPYGGTFLCFTDYARPAIRLAVADGHPRRSIVMTHDSIGLGEDGPTHQPVEHLAALRAIPNLLVFRPADAMETAECWQLALEHRKTPVDPGADPPEPAGRAHRVRRGEPLRQGAYELATADGEAEVTIFATGSEVEIALDAPQAAAGSAVIRPASSRSPAFELFDKQSADYRKAT